MGDIKTLYMSLSPIDSISLLIEGKIGSDGDWFTVDFNLPSGGGADPIDIREVEYIRFQALSVKRVCRLNLFGYYDSETENKVEVYTTGRDLDREVEVAGILHDIRTELRTLNTHMSIITGEEL